MNRIVVYTSGTGFTATYADWIAKSLQCEARELKNVNLEELAEYDQVVYGGWVMAGMVVDYNKIKEKDLKNVVVFAVGMTIPSEALRKQLAEQNGIEPERFFYFEGGYCPEKLGFFKKLIIKMIARSIKKKPEKTEEDLHMLETVKGADRTSREAIAGLVEYCER
ncbi:MAG: hypothetical protein IJY09_02460 [Lachnospiraceae bacterium]|nr:hypothetical protein [Lachnospiraceae bacterium]